MMIFQFAEVRNGETPSSTKPHLIIKPSTSTYWLITNYLWMMFSHWKSWRFAPLTVLNFLTPLSSALHTPVTNLLSPVFPTNLLSANPLNTPSTNLSLHPTPFHTSNAHSPTYPKSPVPLHPLKSCKFYCIFISNFLYVIFPITKISKRQFLIEFKCLKLSYLFCFVYYSDKDRSWDMEREMNDPARCFGTMPNHSFYCFILIRDLF